MAQQQADSDRLVVARMAFEFQWMSRANGPCCKSHRWERNLSLLRWPAQARAPLNYSGFAVPGDQMTATQIAIAHADSDGAAHHRLDEHLSAVARLAECHFHHGPAAHELARFAGLWHDLGKYRFGFQHYIRTVGVLFFVQGCATPPSDCRCLKQDHASGQVFFDPEQKQKFKAVASNFLVKRISRRIVEKITLVNNRCLLDNQSAPRVCWSLSRLNQNIDDVL